MSGIYDLFSVRGKKAVVTGVSSPDGLGYAMAEALADGGAQLMVVSRSEGCITAADNLGAKPLCANLADIEQAEALVPRAIEMLGGLDILVNNAGILTRAWAVDVTFEDYRRVMAINLDAAFVLAQAAGRHMVARGSGKIINIASMTSYVGGGFVAPYAVSKAGMAQLTRTLANEWAAKGVNVNAIAPGYMATDMTARLVADPNRGPGYLSRIPAGRWGKGEDLKGAVIYLASAASDYVHGTIIRVDGGYLAH